MIFDILLVLMLIVTLVRTPTKGCTDDLHFSIGFLIVVRIAGVAYYPLSKILSRFIENDSFAVYAGYLLAALIVFFLFTSIAGQRIIDLAKKIPKTTGRVMTYAFAVFKVIIIYSVIFTFAYTLPFLKRFDDKYITPRTYRLTYGILGHGTEEVFENLKDYLATLRNPVEYFEAQKRKQAAGSTKTLDAVKSHGELQDLNEQVPVKEEPKPEDKK
jgi:hypothetical protein